MEPMCDITLCSADNKLFKVHSKIMSASSRYLKDQLTHVQSTGTLKLQYVKADALEVTIAFIYGTSPKTMSHLKLLQNGAKDLVVHEAMEFCRNQVTELIQYYQVDRPCEKACIIHEYNPNDLKDNNKLNDMCSITEPKNEHTDYPGDFYTVNTDRTFKFKNAQIDNALDETSSHSFVNIDNLPGQSHAFEDWENETTLTQKKSPFCNNSEVQEKNGHELNMFGNVFVDSVHPWISPDEIRKLLDDSDDDMNSSSGQYEFERKYTNDHHTLHSKLCIPKYISEDPDVQLETGTGPFDKTIAEIIPIDSRNSTSKRSNTGLSKSEQDCTLQQKSRQKARRSKENKQNKLQICEECGELFASLPLLIKHKLKVHQKGELFPCTHCTYKTPRKKDIINHVLSRHGVVPPNTKIFSCTKCSYRCADRSRFNEHESRHLSTRDYQCDNCSKMFTTKRGLKNHLMYHNDEFPYVCDQCSASFKVGSKLRDHVRLVHSQKGEKPFKCGYCDFHASIRGNVNQHIKRVHKVSHIKVIDTKADKRRFVKKYFYEDITGNDINSKSLFSS